MSPREGGLLGYRCPRRRLDPTNGGWGGGDLVLCAKGVLPGARVLALLPELGVGAPCPPRSHLSALPAFQVAATSPLGRALGASAHSHLERGEESAFPAGQDWAEATGPARPRSGAAGAPSGDAVQAAAAALGLGCGTHRPAARACRSGPRTGA